MRQLCRKSTSRLITSLLGLRPSASPDLRLTNWTANLTPNLLLARRGFLADQLLNKNEHGWKIVHLHASDVSVASPPR
jgi:hypothetical protein